MKKWMMVLTVVSIAVGAFASEGWESDFKKASARAKAEGKYMLIDFSGSDWCGWCIKLDKEVFSQQVFKDYAKDHLVLLLVDWPQRTPDSKEVQARSRPLMEKFGIDSFPTVILLDPNGEPVDKTGYRPGGAEAYIEYIGKVIAPAKQ